MRLTTAGYEEFERHAAAENRDESDLLAPLTPDERETLAGLLRKLVLAVEDR